MLTYPLEAGRGSLYIQLYALIKDDISQGRLAPREKLPSKRSLAKHLGLSLITVENAYAQLAVEGYIYTRPRQGYYVADLYQGLARRPPLPQPQLPEAGEGPPPAGEAPAGEGVIDLVKSGLPAAAFPFHLWARLLRRTLTVTPEEELITPAPAAGALVLRQALSGYLYQFRGVRVEPRQLIVGAGTQTLYNILVQLLGRDRLYALEDPGYPRLAQVYAANDVACCFLPMDGQGVDGASLQASRAHILHITPSHQFPTGVVMPVSRRLQLLAWAGEAEGRYIIEDDYDCEFRHLGRPLPSLQSSDRQERVIYINTFSKTLSPSLRLSYMVLPRHLARLFQQRLGFYSSTVANLEQYVLAAFIREGYLERHINRMRTYYRGKRDRLLALLAQPPWAGRVEVRGEEQGLHFLLRLHVRGRGGRAVRDQELAAAGAREGLRLSFLSAYYHQPPAQPTHTLLVNYAQLTEEALPATVARLWRALGPYLEEGCGQA